LFTVESTNGYSFTLSDSSGNSVPGRFQYYELQVVDEASMPVVSAVERESAVRERRVLRQTRTEGITGDNIVEGRRVRKSVDPGVMVREY
jgi:hypothetical protein